MKHNNGFIKGALCGALAVLLVLGIISCSRIQNTESSSELSSSQVNKLEHIRSIIDENYIGDLDEESLEEGIYKGYIEGLDDPYSVYYDAEETEELQESTSGEYGGIGVVISTNPETELITVLQVYENSPAAEVGIQADDIIYEIDGKEVYGEDISEVANMVRGEKGTTVKLTVIRGDTGEELTLEPTRQIIEVETVSHEMLDDGIGYLRVTEFDAVTYEQYKSALDDLEANGLKGLVVDLRSNPGGSLAIVCEMLDLMLPEGTIVYTEDKEGHQTVNTSDEEHQFNKPLVVLMDEYSASAAEIYAGAIQDYGKGQVVGTQSYGKGVVQQLYDLRDGTCLRLTMAEYFTPNGRNIDGEGITPDVEIEYEANEEDPEADNQLDKAIEVLKEEL